MATIVSEYVAGLGVACDGTRVVRHESGDGFGGVRIDQQDAQAVGLSQSRPWAGTSEECLPSSLPAGKLPDCIGEAPVLDV